MNGYKYSRSFWDWSFENIQETNPNQISLYFFILEIANRLGWRNEFGITSTECMKALNISYRPYKNAFDNLIRNGFILLIKESNNQWSSNIIALSKKDKAKSNHRTKQSQATGESKVHIQTNNKTKETKEPSDLVFNVVNCLNKISGKSFQAKSKPTIEAINARFSEGFIYDDFKKVIFWKHEEWKDDEKMKKYIQPSTLFRPTKFEEYLQYAKSMEAEKEKLNPPKKHWSQEAFDYSRPADD